MKQYIELCEHVLKHGSKKDDRTGTGTLSCFGYQMRFNMLDGFPLLTTKKVFYPAIIKELLWFISGDTNIQSLVKQNVKIWNEWPYENFKKSEDYKGESLIDFIEKIKKDDSFAQKHGDLGPVYGKQWRDFNGVDQLEKVIDSIKNNPDSRRHIISAWNPSEVDDMALPPCHSFMQFYVNEGRLSLQLYQRSADVFLGVPFNIASYALLLHLVADLCELEAYEFVHTFGDVHIYSNHIEQIKTQIDRKPYALPKLKIVGHHDKITDYSYDDFEIINYQHHPAIRGKVAV